jgi:hypothetical protein
LYGEADGDVNLCRETFAQVPIAGVFCNGEIGPVADSTHQHGYTATLAYSDADYEGVSYNDKVLDKAALVFSLSRTF